jgi:hypothetical protein
MGLNSLRSTLTKGNRTPNIWLCDILSLWMWICGWMKMLLIFNLITKYHKISSHFKIYMYWSHNLRITSWSHGSHNLSITSWSHGLALVPSHSCIGTMNEPIDMIERGPDNNVKTLRARWKIWGVRPFNYMFFTGFPQISKQNVPKLATTPHFF